MTKPDSGTAPMTDRFKLDDLINGLAGDLTDLRAGRISVRDAKARAELAKQILRGVHYVVTAQKFLSDSARRLDNDDATQPRSRKGD